MCPGLPTGLPSLGLSGGSPVATGGTINFAPVNIGTAGDEAASPTAFSINSLATNLSSYAPYIAVIVIVLLLLRR